MTNKPTIKGRSLSRLIAVQALFERQARNEEVNDASQKVSDLCSYQKKIDTDRVDQKFSAELIDQFQKTADKIEEIIKNNLSRTAVQSTLIDIILRCGVCELMNLDTPYKVIIDEYIKLAKIFDIDGVEIDFINAMLDKAAKELKRVED